MTRAGGFDVDASGRSYYVPSSFYIYVAPGVLDADGGSHAATWYRLMHEYGHLVQDRASLFGAIEFLHFFDSLQSAVRLLQDGGPDVSLPLRDRRDAERSWLMSIEKLRGVTYPRRPWGSDVWWAYEDRRVENVDVWYEDSSRSIPVAIASFVDNVSGEKLQHELGPREIKEAYSVAIQVLHGGPVVADADQFEYVALERLFGKAGALDERQMIAICHWALQDSVPGVRLFEIYDMLESDGLPPADELYDKLRDAALGRGLKEKQALFGRQIDEVVNNQRASGERDHLFQALAWYRDRVVRSLSRNLDPTRRFPLDTYLARRSTAPEPALFATMVDDEPIPLVESGTDGAFAFGGEAIDSETVLFIRALSDMVGRLWSSPRAEWPCPLRASCNLALKDGDCERTPWAKSSRTPTCPYGAAALYLGVPARHALHSKP